MLDKLSTGFDKLKYGLVTVAAPRLSLNQPLRWRRDEQNPQFNGELQLAADKVSFSDGGHLPAPVLALQLNGRSPDNFQLQGKLQAQQIGPIAARPLGRRTPAWRRLVAETVAEGLPAAARRISISRCATASFMRSRRFPLPASRASKPAATGW